MDAAIHAQSEVDMTGSSTESITIQGSRQHIMLQNQRELTEDVSPDTSRSVSPDSSPPVAPARRGPVSVEGFQKPPPTYQSLQQNQLAPVGAPAVGAIIPMREVRPIKPYTLHGPSSTVKSNEIVVEIFRMPMTDEEKPQMKISMGSYIMDRAQSLGHALRAACEGRVKDYMTDNAPTNLIQNGQNYKWHPLKEDFVKGNMYHVPEYEAARCPAFGCRNFTIILVTRDTRDAIKSIN